MDVFANLLLGFQTAASFVNLLYCLIGVGDDITEITFCFVARRNRDFSCRRSNVTY